jgi:hypothetical protein
MRWWFASDYIRSDARVAEQLRGYLVIFVGIKACEY